MANPYGIEQVDIPGAIASDDAARERRVQMILQQRQLDQMNLQLDRETKLHQAYAKFRIPGADGGGSSAIAAYDGPPASSASPATVTAPDPNAATPSSTGPLGSIATSLNAMPSDAPAPAPAAPAAPVTAPQSHEGWVQSNASAIQDVLRVDPEAGLRAIQSFHQLDADQQQQLQAHLDLADKVNEHALRLLPGVHDQASWDAARQDYAATFQAYGLPAPNLPPQYDPQMVHNLQLHALSVKEQLDATKPVVLGENSKLVSPQSGAVIADNPKDDLQHFEIHNADGSTTPYAFNPKTGETHQLTDGGAIVPGASTPGNIVQRTHGYTPRQSMGGDNPDNVVDNKIAALTKAVGVSADTPMTPQQFQAFVRALPATEGSGNNNPGGIKDGAFARSQPGYAGAVGQYAKFTTPDAGTAAMTKLLQNNYYNKGQRSIRDIIEGRPVGGTSAAAAATGKPITGAPLASNADDMETAKFIGGQVALGQPMPALGMGKEAAQMRRAILAEATKQWQNMGISPGEANVIAAQNKSGLAELARIATIKASVQTAENTANANAGQVLSLLGSTGTTGVPIFNAWQQAGRRSISGDAKISAFDVAVKTLATEYARVMSGGNSQQLSDSARHEADALIHTSMTPDQFRSAISQMKIDMANRSAGIEQERQATLSQIRTGGRGAAPAPAPANSGAPSVGEVRRGYTYLGGPPGSPSSWRKN